jgi:polyisoprenoid-binding protein YceI
MAWKTDSAHTQLTFVIRHMMISKVRGTFGQVEIDLNLNEESPELSSVSAQIETASINTFEKQRDAHLRSGDFFDSEKYPHMTFKSTKVEPVDDSHARVTGDLTIRDLTKPVVLDVEYVGRAKSPWGGESIGLNASTQISRKEWDLTWNVALETGGWLVGDEIKIEIEAEFVQQ